MESLGQRIKESEQEQKPDLLSRMVREERSMNWRNYQRYDTIVAWIDQLAADNPSVVTLTELGKSHEDRRIVMLKIGRSPRGAETRAVWIDGGIHAREWIAPATIWDLIQLLQRTLHPIMNSRTKIVYKNTTEKVCFLSREIVQRKLTTFLCKIRPY